MEVGGSEHYPDGELGVIYFRKPGMDEKWQKLTDIAAARVSLKDEYMHKVYAYDLYMLFIGSVCVKWSVCFLYRVQPAQMSITFSNHNCVSIARSARYTKWVCNGAT